MSLVSSLTAQPLRSDQVALNGDLLLDSEPALETRLQVPDFLYDETKKPWKAALMSAVVPGSGEWYAEAYKSAIGFFAAEVVFVVAAWYYESEAVSETKAYQKIADDPSTGWSARKYADYLIYVAEVSSAQDELARTQAASLKSRLNPNDNQLPGNREWWGELNRLEEKMKFEHGAGASFSHSLPSYGSQQYYELIGKYDQFTPGWWDFGNQTPGNWNAPQDISLFRNLGSTTPSFQRYADLRGKANDLHNLANGFIILTLANHAVSAVNAAIQSRLHNRVYGLSLRSVPVTPDTRVPALTLTYSF
ncbi:MAG: hypothetical protein HUU10_03110 [Bacteroidetes bacterium]|nr:hypothetical protein [Bacteroidota bacterium]